MNHARAFPKDMHRPLLPPQQQQHQSLARIVTPPRMLRRLPLDGRHHWTWEEARMLLRGFWRCGRCWKAISSREFGGSLTNIQIRSKFRNWETPENIDQLKEELSEEKKFMEDRMLLPSLEDLPIQKYEEIRNSGDEGETGEYGSKENSFGTKRRRVDDEGKAGEVEGEGSGERGSKENTQGERGRMNDGEERESGEQGNDGRGKGDVTQEVQNSSNSSSSEQKG
jgi:hypothetical protein